MLVLLEHILQEGEPLVDQLKKLQGPSQTDKRLMQFNAANSLVNSDGKEAVKALEKVNREDLKRDHVIDIMSAVAKMVSGDAEGAKVLYLKALEVNPYITGIYHDLGGIFHNGYDTRLAWECWDLARRIAPGHSMLQPIKNYEQQLAKDFPEYFE